MAPKSVCERPRSYTLGPGSSLLFVFTPFADDAGDIVVAFFFFDERRLFSLFDLDIVIGRGIHFPAGGLGVRVLQRNQLRVVSIVLLVYVP